MTYFQYQKGLNLPIYIRAELDLFDPYLSKLLGEMGLERLQGEDAVEARGKVERVEGGRLLTLEEATPLVAKKIDFMGEWGQYGEESINPGYDCQIYRYRSVAIMPHSYGSPLWGLGCHKDFGSNEKAMACRIVLNRFLSYALLPMGIVGLWGEAVEGGIVLFRPGRGEGKAVFVDVKKQSVLAPRGGGQMGEHFKVFRLSVHHLSRDVVMEPEELIPCLFSHLCYFSYKGPGKFTRRAIQVLARLVKGVDCSPGNFQSISELSL